MTEIEKMYENTGIEKKRYCEFEDECPYSFGHCCKDCDIELIQDKYSYPPFTTEKQIELIKWLAKIYELSINWDEQYYSYRFVIRNYKNGRLNHSVCNYEESFEETLAYLINRIWQDLTDQEKEEIRRILNE